MIARFIIADSMLLTHPRSQSDLMRFTAPALRLERTALLLFTAKGRQRSYLSLVIRNIS